MGLKKSWCINLESTKFPFNIHNILSLKLHQTLLPNRELFITTRWTFLFPFPFSLSIFSHFRQRKTPFRSVFFSALLLSVPFAFLFYIRTEIHRQQMWGLRVKEHLLSFGDWTSWKLVVFSFTFRTLSLLFEARSSLLNKA